MRPEASSWFTDQIKGYLDMIRDKNHLFSDLAQMANGAASALNSLREDISVIRASRQDRNHTVSGAVTIEEFEALVTRIDALASRIAALEAGQSGSKKPKAAAKAKASAKK